MYIVKETRDSIILTKTKMSVSFSNSSSGIRPTSIWWTHESISEHSCTDLAWHGLTCLSHGCYGDMTPAVTSLWATWTYYRSCNHICFTAISALSLNHHVYHSLHRVSCTCIVMYIYTVLKICISIFIYLLLQSCTVSFSRQLNDNLNLKKSLIERT